MLSELKMKSKVIGVKQSMKAIKSGKAAAAYFADDADPSLLEPIRKLCEAENVKTITVETMTALGHACDIDVGAAIAVVLKDGCTETI